MTLNNNYEIVNLFLPLVAAKIFVLNTYNNTNKWMPAVNFAKKEFITSTNIELLKQIEDKCNIELGYLLEENFLLDDLLEEASDEISLEDTLEIPKTNNLDAIEEELEKLDAKEKTTHKDLDDTLDSDLFELIDSMYDDREEV